MHRACCDSHTFPSFLLFIIPPYKAGVDVSRLFDAGRQRLTLSKCLRIFSFIRRNKRHIVDEDDISRSRLSFRNEGRFVLSEASPMPDLYPLLDARLFYLVGTAVRCKRNSNLNNTPESDSFSFRYQPWNIRLSAELPRRPRSWPFL